MEESVVDIRVGKRAQIVIPVEIRKRLGVEEGDLLHAEIDAHGRIVLEPVPQDPLERLKRAGAGLYAGVDAVEAQRRIRDEWDR